MINVTTAFKNAMKAPVKTVNATVAFVDGDTYTSGDNLVKCELQANGYYFGVATKAVTVVLLGTNYDLVDKKFDLTLKVLADSTNNTWEDCILGRFKVVEQTVDLEKEMTTLKAYDAIGIIGSKLYKEGDFAFPITVNALAERLAIDSGMDVEELELVNGTYEIPEDLYAKINNITHRDILAEISGATASLAAVHGVDSELTFTTPMMEPVDSLSYDNLKKVKLEPKYGKVSSVVIARTPQEDNIAVVDDATTLVPAGKNLADPSTYPQTQTLNGITCVFDSETNIFTFNGTCTKDNTCFRGFRALTMDGEYTLSCFVVGGSLSNITGATKIQFQNGTSWAGNNCLLGNSTTSRTFTLNNLLCNTNNIRFDNGVTANNYQIQVQLEKSPTRTDFEPFIPNGIVEVKLANNEILDDNREAMAEPILDAVKGFGFRPFEATTEGHGWHEIGDRLRLFNETLGVPVEYQEVEYLESTGTQFINTGYITKTNTRVELIADITYGSTGSTGHPNNQGRILFDFRNIGTGSSQLYLAANSSQVFNNIPAGKHKYFIDAKNFKLGYDNTVVTKPQVSLVMCGVPMALGAWLENNRYYYYTEGKIYRFSAYEDDILVRDFVPCVRKSDGVAGFYEVVQGVFYTNDGTGDYIAGAKTGVDVDNDCIADVILTDIKLTIDGGLTEVLKGVAPDETKTNYALAGGIKKTIYNTEIKVDKQGQEITSVVSRQEQFENETLENFTQVVQNISSITTTIQTTGGGNLIHNSVGYNVDSNRNLVNWTSTGTISADSSPESVSYGALSGNQINLSASSSITQRIAVDTQGSVYSFSFKAKKGATGTATVHLRNSVDDYSITLPANQAVLWQSYNLNNLTPHDSYFDVVVETNNNITDFAITDIILNVGDSNTPWVPASDEILSKSVAIDGSGVTVRSNTNDDYVKLDEFGLNGYHGQTNVFKLQQDVTEVAKLKARNQIEMPPIKIVPITSGSRAGWCFVKEEN